MLRLLTVGALAAMLVACNGKEPPNTTVKEPPAKKRFVIVCTTTIINEMTEILAGHLVNPTVEIRCLMQREDDPHDYVIRPADLQTLREADLILMNGLDLEATLEPVIAEQAKDAVIVRLGEASGVTHVPGHEGKPDPHVWMSPANYEAMMMRAADGLAKVVTLHGAEIRRRAQDHSPKVAELRVWVEGKAAELSERRTMLTSDDGLAYLGSLLGVKVVYHPVDLRSLPTEADRDALLAAVDRDKPQAVFIDRGESSIWHEVVADLAGTRNVAVGPSLLSHGLAEKEQLAGTYLGLVRSDVESIVQVLSMEPKIGATAGNGP